MLSSFSRLSLLALTTLGATLGFTTLGASSASANPNALSDAVDNVIFAETVENFTQGDSSNWNSMHGTIHDEDHERWVNGWNNNAAVLGANTWESTMTHKHRNADGTTRGWDKTVGLSLGKGGSLTVGFGDNYLKGNGDDSSDIWIYEIGRLVEKTFVEVGDDQGNWYNLGIANRTDREYSSGVGINIDSLFDETHDFYQAGLDKDTLFSFVRVTDDVAGGGHGGFKSGADIDAIAALTFVVKDEVDSVDVPEPGLMLGFGLMGAGFLFRRRSNNPA